MRVQILHRPKRLQAHLPDLCSFFVRHHDRRAEVVGARNSYHLRGMAVDIAIQGLDVYRMAPLAEQVEEWRKLIRRSQLISDTLSHYIFR